MPTSARIVIRVNFAKMQAWLSGEEVGVYR